MSVPFRSFVPHFLALARVGFYGLVPPSESAAKNRLNQLFRFVVPILVLIDNVQLTIFLFMVWGDTAKMAPTLLMLLSTINCCLKFATINMKREKMQDVIDTINGPPFQPTSPYHHQVLDSNAKAMSNLIRFLTACSLLCCIFYAIFPFMDLLRGQVVEIHAWIPFEPPGSPLFEIILLYQSLMITTQAYGQTTMDCFIVALYSQATSQIKILRHNFQNIVHDAEIANSNSSKTFMHKEIVLEKKFKKQSSFNNSNDSFTSGVPQGSVLCPGGYSVNTNNFDSDRRDIIEDKYLQKHLHKRLIIYVNHYRTILRFIEEIQSIFKVPLSFQCIAAAWIICMTVYNITVMNQYLTIEFAFLLSYLMVMLIQLFIYCYYGTELTFESEQLNDSIYSSQWWRTTPRFRKMLLIQMSRCSRPVEPKVAFIVPLSLATYTSVMKFSYTLFAVLRKE